MAMEIEKISWIKIEKRIFTKVEVIKILIKKETKRIGN